MKKIFEKLGIKKADEMEKSILLKSIQLAWLYTVIFLFVWSLFESRQARLLNERVNLIPGGLLVSQNLILILSQIFFRFRMSGGEDEAKKSPMLQVLLVIAIAAVAILTAGLLARFIIG